MVRVKAASLSKRKQVIEWRSHEPSRLETFSDAVFAFAVTLIIVSLEVPKSYSELIETMKGTFSFAICFALLFNIWHTQNLFFRRFGLNDIWTVTLNGALLFVVLVYAYPLKFLFVLMFYNNSYMINGHLEQMMQSDQTPVLMTIYGAGFSAIYLLFFLMYLNAKKHADELKLNALELYETNTQLYTNIIGFAIGVIAIILAWVLPIQYSGSSGLFYFVIGIAYSILFSYRGKKQRKLFGI